MEAGNELAARYYGRRMRMQEDDCRRLVVIFNRQNTEW